MKYFLWILFAVYGLLYLQLLYVGIFKKEQIRSYFRNRWRITGEKTQDYLYAFLMVVCFVLVVIAYKYTSDIYELVIRYAYAH